MICLWDLLTGACAYSILAHDGEVAALAHSPSYVISLGLADAKICVWERFQGHHINTIQLVSMKYEDSNYRVTMVVRCYVLLTSIWFGLVQCESDLKKKT